MGRAGSALVLSLILALGFALCKADAVLAANVAVSPVNISLTREVHSMLLTVSNQGAQTVRFSLDTFAWAESDAGKMQLGPSADIIFFPTLLSVAPGESRNIRLGTQQRPGDIEKAYRIVLEELPSPQTSASAGGVQIRVLTKISIPIFVVPDKPTTRADISSISTAKSGVSFRIENTGNVHIPPGAAVVSGSDESDKPIVTKNVNVWYVLAGGTRTVNASLPAGVCAKVKKLSISMKLGTVVVKKSQATPSGACLP